MKLGVIADTHGLYDPAIERHFAGVRGILHAGDIGDRRVIDQLEKIAPVVAVSGNVDEYEASGFPRRTVVTRGGIRIGLTHVLYEKGTIAKETRAWLEHVRPALCIFGHSHRPSIGRYGETILFNPGSAGPRRFSLPRGIGLLTIDHGKIGARCIRLDDSVSHMKSNANARRSVKKRGGVR